MMWTKQRLIFVGLLAVAGGALAVDRFILGGGQDHAVPPSPNSTRTQAAEPAPAASTNALPRDSAAAPAPSTRTPLISVTDRLQPLLRFPNGPILDEHRNAMQIPSAWALAIAATSAPPSADLAAAPAPQPEILPTFRLTMIVRDKSGTPIAAWINGQLVRPGGSIAGFTLTSIAASSSRGENLGIRLARNNRELIIPFHTRNDLPHVVGADDANDTDSIDAIRTAEVQTP